MRDAKIEQIKEVVEEYHRLREEKLSEADVLEDFVARLFRALGWDTYSPLEWNRQKFIRKGGYADVALQIDNKPVIFLEAKKLGKIHRAEVQREPLLAVQQSLFDGEWVPSSAQRVKRAGDRTPEEKQALRYARADVKVKWAILTNFERLLLFDADEERIILAFDTPEAYVDRFEDLKYLQKDRVAKGSLDWYKGQLEKAEIDEGFYGFLLEWRKRLAQNIYDEDRKRNKSLFHPRSEEKLDLLGQAVQRTLDRLIIIRYADDVGALLRHDQLEGILASYQAKGPYAGEYELQRDVNSFYHAFYREHDTAIFASPHICEQVLISNKTVEALLGDLTNISFRKFTSDILGNTYESYLGHKLKLVGDKIELEARRELRKGKGIYYTPTYIVRYIVDNTLGKYLYGTVDGKPDGQREEGARRRTLTDISDLRVLDPAMGSGSFLIYAFDVLADFYERENKRIEEENAAIWDRWGKEQLQKGMFGKDNEMPTLEATEPNYIGKMLQEHLYGVDLDREAVEIAGVNLIMRAFDRLKNGPTREQRKLPLILRQNLKMGNSLISGVAGHEDWEPHREAIMQLIEKRKELTQLRGDEQRNDKLAEMEAAGKTVNEALNANLEEYFGDGVEVNQPFNWHVEFPEVFARGGFNIVIGNPPYVSFGLRGVERVEPAVDRYLRDKYPNSAEYKLSQYAIFTDRALQLLHDGGYFSFIVPDSFLLGRYFSKLRRLILDTCAIKDIVLFSQDFWASGTVGLPVIIVLQKVHNEAKRKRNRLTARLCIDPSQLSNGAHLTGYAYEQSHFETVPYNRFRLFFDAGSKRLVEKMEESTVWANEIVSIHTGVRSKIGQKKIVSRDRHDPTWHRGLLSGREIQRYSLDYAGWYLHISPKLLFKGGWDPEIVLSEKLLMRQTGDSLVATLDINAYYHLNNLHSIVLRPGVRYSLKYLLGILNSKLMNHYYHLISLEKGRAMAQTDIETIEKLPIGRIEFDNPQDLRMHDDLVAMVERMLDLNSAKQKAQEAFIVALKGYEREYVSLWEAYYDHSEYRGTHIQCQPLIDANEKGEVTGIKVDENPDTQSLRIAGKVDNQWRDIVRLGIEDEGFRLFLLFGLRAFLEEKRRKKIWSRGKILRGVLEALQVPVLAVAKAQLNIKRIKQLMDEFKRKCPSEALHLSQLEATLHDTDAEIDDLVYDLYGTTAEEREIIESNLR